DPPSAVFYSALLSSAPATADIYTLSLHDALPIWTTPSTIRPAPTRTASCRSPRPVPSSSASPSSRARRRATSRAAWPRTRRGPRSEEHTSELQSRENLVCRLLLEKKKRL